MQSLTSLKRTYTWSMHRPPLPANVFDITGAHRDLFYTADLRYRPPLPTSASDLRPPLPTSTDLRDRPPPTSATGKCFLKLREHIETFFTPPTSATDLRLRPPPPTSATDLRLRPPTSATDLHRSPPPPIHQYMV